MMCLDLDDFFQPGKQITMFQWFNQSPISNLNKSSTTLDFSPADVAMSCRSFYHLCPFLLMHFVPTCSENSFTSFDVYQLTNSSSSLSFSTVDGTVHASGFDCFCCLLHSKLFLCSFFLLLAFPCYYCLVVR